MTAFRDRLTAYYLLCWAGLVEEWRFRLFGLL